MMLLHANANWEETEYTFEQWPLSKHLMPNGKMPCLELKDGTKMGESYAISRYLGSIHGLYPSDPKVAYEVDYLLEGFEGCLSTIPAIHFT